MRHLLPAALALTLALPAAAFQSGRPAAASQPTATKGTQVPVPPPPPTPDQGTPTGAPGTAAGVAAPTAAPPAPAVGTPAAPSQPAPSGYAAPAVPADAPAPAPEHDNGETLWPQEATLDGTSFVLYTPQFESIAGTRATGRMAFSTHTGADTAQPAFGVAFFEADLDNDTAAGLIELSGMQVTRVQPSDGGDGAASAAALQKMLGGVQFTVDRAVALATMQVAKDQASTRASLNNSPPKIRVVSKPAVLLLLDGKPVLRDAGTGGLGIAQNTASLLAFEKATRTWFTRVGTDTWLHSSRWQGPFIPGKSPNAESLQAIDRALPKRHPDASASPAVPTGKVPEVFVSTTPMCLVSTDGDPAFTPVADGLTAVTNANCDLFRTADGTWWLLASGRWFTTTNLSLGPWTYAKPSTLPGAFAQIDPHGTWGNVLASVPGTPQATDALYQQSVPHVATLDRKLAQPKLTTFGGPARFKPIDGTGMQYAVNASSPLILCKGAYYLCENAAWFKGAAANGPWELCETVPEEIYTIPPSCPVYGATYVQVYNSTPDTVTTGYTAGYMNSYENDGTVAYGTGYAYPGSTGQGDVVLGDNSDITDDDTWDSYGGWPNTYGYWPMYGGYYGGWGLYGYPGWAGYGLWCGPYWGGAGWWGAGRGFGTGFALGMGLSNSWNWGYHPWGWRDGNGWWNNHWGGAYRRGWDGAARGYNRAGAAADMNAYARGAGGGMAAAQTGFTNTSGLTAGIGETRVPGETAGVGGGVPGWRSGSGQWRHAAALSNDVAASRSGQVVQQRNGQNYTRSNGSWQRAQADSAGAPGAANAASARTNDGSWRDGAANAHARAGGSNFREGNGSGDAALAARNGGMDGFRPDPNHNFDGSPRGAFARGDTNYADRGQQAWGPSDGGRTPSAYQRGGSWNGGSWNGGGWGVGDQHGTYAQRWGNDYDRGTRGFNQDTGWYDRTASRPANPYGYGYSGWSNGYRGYSAGSSWGGARMGGVRSTGGGMRGGGGRR